MLWQSLHRVRQLAGVSRTGAGQWLAAIGAAFSAGAFLVVVGMAVQSATEKSGRDPVLGYLLEEWRSWRAGVFSPEYDLLVATIVASLLALVILLSIGFRNRLATQAGIQTAARLLSSVERQMAALGTSVLLETPRPEQRLLDGIDQVRDGVARSMRTVPFAPVSAATWLALAVVDDYRVALAAALVAAAAFGLRFAVQRLDAGRLRRWRERYAEAHAALANGLRQTPLMVSFSAGFSHSAAYGQAIREYDQAVRNSSTSFGGPVWRSATVPAACLFLCGGLAVGCPLPTLLVSGGAFLASLGPILRILRRERRTLPAEEAAKWILAFLDREPAVRERGAARDLSPLAQSVRFESVTFADLDAERTVDGLRWEIAAGTRVGVVSTDERVAAILANLIARSVDPAAGRILYDGVDLRDATLASVRRQIAHVPAFPTLLPATIADNIGCGDENCTRLQISDAAKQARAYNFIQELPGGLSSRLSAESRLPPGRAFRIGLARAVLRDPSVLWIVEPPRDEVDEESWAHIDEALRLVSDQRTLLIVPARLATLRGLDTIALLHRGQLAAQGTHTELLRTSELYRHLVYQRFQRPRESDEPVPAGAAPSS